MDLNAYLHRIGYSGPVRAPTNASRTSFVYSVPSVVDCLFSQVGSDAN